MKLEDDGCGDLRSRVREDRRRYLRLACPTAVAVRPANAPAGGTDVVSDAIEAKTGRSVNLSAGGIRFECDDRFAVGSALDIEVAAQNHTQWDHNFGSLKGRAVVRRVDGETAPYQIAAEFVWVA